MRRWLLILALMVPSFASAQTTERCFPETGQCISGRIREFWEKNGALPVFGFPIGPQQEEQIEGRPFQVQRFERNRLELHPENARPYDVLLGRLGADRLAQQGRDWQAVFARSESQSGCRYFPETSHNVCGDILASWRASGLDLDGRTGKTEAENLALFGLPISDLVTERQADGQDRQVQWFERARFELHPENQPPYHVLLGLLGNEIRDNGGGGAPSPAPSAGPLVITGNGAKVTDPIALPASIVKVTGSHRGSSNFAVWAYFGNDRDLLFNTIGNHDGVRPLRSTAPTYFEVSGDGDWSLTIEPLPQQPDAAGGISGHGQVVSGYFQPRASRVPFSFSHDGSSNFAVWVWCAGTSRDLAVNEIGPYQGEAVVDFGRGPCYWDVEADGNWTIRIK